MLSSRTRETYYKQPGSSDRQIGGHNTCFNVGHSVGDVSPKQAPDKCLEKIEQRNFKKANMKSSHQGIWRALPVIKWTVLSAIGLFGAIFIIGLGGYRIPFWPSDTEVTYEKPFSSYIGRELHVTGAVTALAWNDFPDKSKILVVSLTSPPGASNRFVSRRIPLRLGQKVIILSAWRSLSLVEFTYYYLVSVPGAGLPEDIPIHLKVDADGVPDTLVYKSTFEQSTRQGNLRRHLEQ